MLVKMKMSMCWMFMILLGCSLSHATQSTNRDLDTKCVLDTKDVHVPCPNMTGDIMMFSLLKDHNVISNVSCNNTCVLTSTWTGVKIDENMKRKTFDGFIISGINNSISGYYTCEGKVTFPPPYISGSTSLRIMVTEGYVPEAKNCHILVWIIVVTIVSVYSLFVTIIAVVFWFKLGKTDTQSDYMNTKPRLPRKNKGLRSPFPRHV